MKALLQNNLLLTFAILGLTVTLSLVLETAYQYTEEERAWCKAYKPFMSLKACSGAFGY